MLVLEEVGAVKHLLEQMTFLELRERIADD